MEEFELYALISLLRNDRKCKYIVMFLKYVQQDNG